LQQTPSTQKPSAHWLFPAQAPPTAFFVTHAPVWQNWEADRQSESTVQSVLQEVAPQMNGAQELGAPGGQLPLPSHFDAGVRVEPLQLALPHEVVLGVKRQVPAPLQNPSRPHRTVSAAHSFAGSVPLSTEAQVPSAGCPVCVALQDTHRPLHRLLQHTPSMQNPSRHSVAAEHAVPSTFCGVHCLVVRLQKFVPTQSWFAVHAVLQPAVGSHTAAPHAICVALPHIPWLHVLGDRKVPELHIPCPHWVPFGHFSHCPAPSHEPS